MPADDASATAVQSQPTAKRVPPPPPVDDDDDDDLDRRPKRRASDDDDDDDARPARRRARADDDDEDDDRPAKRRARAADDEDGEDEDRRARKRRRNDDDDEEDDDDVRPAKRRARDDEDEDEDDDARPARRRSRDDVDDDDRPARRSRRKNDDDDEDDRPRKKRGRKKPNMMLFVAIGGGAGVLLLVVILFFVVSGLFSRGAARQFESLIPPTANSVWMVDVGAMRARDAETARNLDAFFDDFFRTNNEGRRIPAALRPSIKGIDTAMFAGNIDAEQFLVAVHTTTAFKRDDLKRYMEGTDKPGKNYFETRMGPNRTALVATPDDNTVILGVMSETDFTKALGGSTAASPVMQKEIAHVSGAPFWGALVINGKMQESLQQMPPQQLEMVGGERIVPILPRLRSVSIAQHSPPGSGAKIVVNATCADDKDAETLRSWGQNLWEGKGKAMVGSLNAMAMMANDNEVTRSVNQLTEDVNKTFQLSRSASTVTATVGITEATFMSLQKLQKKALPGGLPFP